MNIMKKNKSIVLKALIEKLYKVSNKRIVLKENLNELGEDTTTINGVYELVEGTLKNSGSRLCLNRIDENLARNNVSLRGEIDFNEYTYVVNKFLENGFRKSSPMEMGGKIYDNYISKCDSFTITIPKSKA